MKDFIIKNGILYAYKGKASSIRIPNSVTEIGSEAFANCISLTHVEIPNSVTKINDGAFVACYTLTSVKIPNSVTEISFNAFRDCIQLASIEIPNSVKRIATSAFMNCSSLTHIEIPNSVTSIGEYAFYHCYNLTSIKIPNSVIWIGCCAFDEITQVKPQYNANGSLRAFKAFKADWTCRRFQYKVGKSFHHVGISKVCISGFHACPNPLSVFNHYDGDLSQLRFAEVELSGEMDSENDKVAASDIRIVRELTATELAEIYNSMEKEIC